MRVFFEFDVDEESKKYELAKKFVKENFLKYSLSSSDLAELEDEELEQVQDLYVSDSRNEEAIFFFEKRRLEFDLYSDCPETVKNFIGLVTGENKKKVSYKFCRVFRIEPSLMQTGDVTFQDGTGGESIFGKKFKDEPAGLKRTHEVGSLAMANSGKNSNTSQFFVCFEELKQLDGKHVVFGKTDNFVVLESLKLCINRSVTISDCGLL